MFVLPKQLPKQDLLNEWVKRVRWQSSYLNPHPSIKIDDQTLFELRDFLRSFFGADYFETTFRVIRDISIKTKNSNWIFQLLANDDYPSLLHLFEVAHILRFVSSHQPHLLKILKSNTKKQAFRNYLFEGIVYEMLHANGITFDPKPIVNGKEREGFLQLEGEKLLFECKKLYSYQLPGMHFIFTIHQEFFRLWFKQPVSVNGYISIRINNEEILARYRNKFHESFKRFFAHVRESINLNFQEDIVDDANEIIGSVHIEPYSFKIFNYAVETLQYTTVCFCVRPPILRSIEEELKELRNTKILFKFSVTDSASGEFLIRKLAEKRHSQSDLQHLPRIFFFDNEVYRGMEPALFQAEHSIPEDMIQDYLESKKTNDILCVVFRKYHLVKKPSWALKVFCRPELERLKKLIESYTTLYSQQLFLDRLPASLV